MKSHIMLVTLRRQHLNVNGVSPRGQPGPDTLHLHINLNGRSIAVSMILNLANLN